MEPYTKQMIFKCAAVLAGGGALFGGISPFFSLPGAEVGDVHSGQTGAVALGALQGAIMYFTLSILGMVCAKRLGWDSVPLLMKILRKQPMAKQLREVLFHLFPVGIGIGALLVLLHKLQAARLPTILSDGFHPPPATAILASFAAGFGEELIFRLFLLSLLAIALKFIGDKSVHIAVLLSAVAHAAGHIPAAVVLTGKSLGAMGPSIWLYILTLNGVSSIFFGYIYIGKGWEAAAASHFGADIVWHTIYPLL
jgi:hypothetical protein